MIDEPQVVQTQAQPAAVIHITIPREQIRDAMGAGIGELMSTIAAQGIPPAGPLFSHHFRMAPDTFDFEVGVPVSRAVTPAGRVQAGELPARRVLRTVYHGGYEGLGAAWGEFGGWIAAHGHAVAEDLWECYVAGPESGPDSSRWQTELNRPLAG